MSGFITPGQGAAGPVGPVGPVGPAGPAGPAGPGRTLLTANRTFYVRTNGNDANDGSANDAAHAWLTIQHGIDIIKLLDFSIYTVTLQVGDGNYAGGGVVDFCFVSTGQALTGASFIIQGNPINPGNVVIHTVSHCFHGAACDQFTIKDMALQSDAGFCLWAHDFAQIIFDNLIFKAAVIHIYAAAHGRIVSAGNYTISGATVYHIACEELSEVIISNRTITFTVNPTAITTYAYVDKLGHASLEACAWINAGFCVGSRYNVWANGVIWTAGAGAGYLPGTIGGASASGGQYL